MNDPVARVRAHVQAHDPHLDPMLFDKALPTSQAAADHLGVALGQIAKSILFRAGDRFGLFVAAGDRRIDPELVRAHLGGERPRIARPAEVEDVTGFTVGAVCPFALRQPVPVFVDASLARYDTVYTAAGRPESLLPIPFDRLVSITGATVVESRG